MVSEAGIDLDRVRTVAGSVVDPEIPVLTVADLGIIREVREEDGKVIVTITPTYSGCPAMGQIRDDIATALAAEGHRTEVRTRHNPPWTTEWISAAGLKKLGEFGVAPPTSQPDMVCPLCRAPEPLLVSVFGSTACKALMVCSSCGEPFDYFKRF
jgi:ring-1,2-phenylacetyl-CoA epoxidase subunit PaaD